MNASVLLIGYGNPGRRDDGLGPLAVAAIDLLDLPDVTVEEAYQLQVELAEPIAGHDVVVFVDASVSGREPFELRDVEPSLDFGFSTHAMSPEGILGVAHSYTGSCKTLSIYFRHGVFAPSPSSLPLFPPLPSFSDSLTPTSCTSPPPSPFADPVCRDWES